tara:strand:- start:51 stop:338 length:288 start_codon:yes stop_codon:yes gene_type:complete
MTPLERMIEDAKICNNRLYKLEGKMNVHKRRGKLSSGSKPKQTPRSATFGEGWRNSPLTEQEVEDIKYFLSKGWCLGSTSKIVGVSISTVRKYVN